MKMNTNVRIARELVRLAKSLAAADGKEWYVYARDTATGELRDDATDFGKIFSNQQQARNYCRKRNNECARQMLDVEYVCYPCPIDNDSGYDYDYDYEENC